MKLPTTYQEIIPFVFDTEGGYVNRKSDRGGPTKYGMTLGTMKALKIDLNNDGVVDIEDVKILTPEECYEAFYSEFWVRGRVNQCPGYLRYFYFDGCIHHSVRRMVRVLQKAYNHGRKENLLKVDGKFGPKTTKAMKRLPLDLAIYYRIILICDIVRNDKTQMEHFRGWMNRVTEFLKYV